MLIKKEHAVALYNVLGEENKGTHCQISVAAEREPYNELNLANLLEMGSSKVEFRLSYWGRNLVYLLDEMIQNGKLDIPANWKEGYRWIGSETIAMIEAAMKNGGFVGPVAEEALTERGFAEKVRDEHCGECTKLNDYAEALYDIYLHSHPKLEITQNLANFIVSMPEGPAEKNGLDYEGREAELLESMRLLSYSVPNTDIFSLNRLGKAVKNAITHMAYPYDAVISEDYLHVLAYYLDNGFEALNDKEKELMESLALIDAEGKLLPGGEALEEVLHILREQAYLPARTFDLEALDVEILRGIDEVMKRHESNPEVLPAPEEIRHYLLDLPLKEYKAVKEHYGRRLNEDMGYQKKEELKKKFAEALTVEELFKSFYEKGNHWLEKLMDVIEESLMTLKSFSLVEAKLSEDGKLYYDMTPEGRLVFEEQKEKGFREISAPAVKAITIRESEFGAPNLEWYEAAKAEHLVGGGAPTHSGEIYADLAYNVERKPHITRFELQILHKLPERGYFVESLYEDFDPTLKEEVTYGLNKLEARGFVELLPDGGVVVTEAGHLIKRALSGTPESFGNALNPLVVRVLDALHEVGNLYVKERKVRILPKNIKEAIKISGLDPETFNKALTVARNAKFIGHTSINEAGLDILEAYELLNS
ncbi:DUF505 domain-containing protein [Nitratifractor salsuginis]|uniref:DUF505 domain-containing protein n=1 Tax=Nitratifractor salsuginis (strain DSM 16511 / JCM 12458 / E9I37-1) TaxID=749222 RepID=E6X1K4_NITSE|nr:DUF505 domain-containing protein [Nitratifractor salsuginis]ADV45937.1 protein of unknown function DUF505 [Nitratifractor salsuginis DSM 16511]